MAAVNNIPKTMKAAVITAAGQPLSIQEVPMPEPQPGELLIKVHACGVCHSDSNVLAGDFGPPQITRLGHEFVGTVVAVPKDGNHRSKFAVGDRVGGAWHGGHDGTCRSCGRGQFQMCEAKSINGVMRDGGYGEYATLRAEAAVRIPADVDAAEVAPLLCAGVTVFNGMRNMHVRTGDVVAVQGLGGLGHLAIQYARKMGFRTVALSRGAAKKQFALDLGANDYIDTAADEVGAALQKLGGAAMIVVTAPNPDAMAPLLQGLAPGGKLLVHAVGGAISVDTATIVTNALSVCGWPSGHALDSEEAIAFAHNHGVKCMIEKFPLDKANEAMQHMLSGKARFRAVLTMD